MAIFTTVGSKLFIGPPQATDLTIKQYKALETGSFAEGTATFSANPADGDTLVFNGTTVTFANTPVGALDVKIGVDLDATLDNFIAKFRGSLDAQLVKFAVNIKQDVGDFELDTIIIISAVTGGTGGNSLTITKVSTAITLSGATLAGGGGDAWVQINEIENLGDFGDAASSVNFTSIADARVRKLKGSRDAGNMNLVCGFDARDAGQRKLRRAQETNFYFAFRLIASDKRLPTDSATTFYFNGLVDSQKVNFGANNNVAKTTFMIGVNTEVLMQPTTPSGVTVYEIP